MKGRLWCVNFYLFYDFIAEYRQMPYRYIKYTKIFKIHETDDDDDDDDIPCLRNSY